MWTNRVVQNLTSSCRTTCSWAVGPHSRRGTRSTRIHPNGQRRCPRVVAALQPPPYGQTADVAAAKAAGVHITLAPDWAPSGSKSPRTNSRSPTFGTTKCWGHLHRLRNGGGGTSAALATNWHNEVGTLEAGKAADLVDDNIHANPYRNLINAIDPDVRLTVVGGLAVYGDEDLMANLKGTTSNQPVSSARPST